MKSHVRDMGAKIRSAARALHARAAAVVAAGYGDEDRRRRELILNVILAGSIFFLAALDIMVAYNSIRISYYYGISFPVFTAILLIYIGMFIASKRGYGTGVSYILIGIYAVGSIYGGWLWGASLPATLLMFALVSTMSGILIGPRFGLVAASLLTITLIILGIHEIRFLGIQSWKYEVINPTDIILYGAIILFIAAISWLSARELEKSLRRTRQSEKELARERDLLELRVAKRSRELEKLQAERVDEMSRAAEFGRLSRGFFHDLMTPLTSVALQIEKLETLEKNTPKDKGISNVPKLEETSTYIKKAIAASERMARFMENIRRTIKKDTENVTDDTIYETDIEHEALFAIDLLAYKARQAGVHLEMSTATDTRKDFTYPANPFHFQQIFQNLLSNAIEAGGDNVNIHIDSNDGTISVSDNGSGIDSKNTSKIFDPFFTTKKGNQNSGIGLHTVKTIVEEKLHGTIEVRSDKTTGTVFTVKLSQK